MFTDHAKANTVIHGFKENEQFLTNLLTRYEVLP